MRIGFPIEPANSDPSAWAAEVRRLGCSAAYCPVDEDADAATVCAFADAARAANIRIAEVGAWSNPLASDSAERSKAITLCQRRLDLADRIGAGCCVNIAGSRGLKWDGPCADDLTDETFDLIVESVRVIIDAVKPTRTFYALETMPWMFPHSVESYLRLLKAIDRPAAAAHLDVVNLINSPLLYFQNAKLIADSFAKLGPRIKSCHVKDIRLGASLTVHLDEVRPGQGGLDYAAFLRAAGQLGPDLPIMLEHLPCREEYVAGAQYIRELARTLEIEIL